MSLITELKRHAPRMLLGVLLGAWGSALLAAGVVGVDADSAAKVERAPASHASLVATGGIDRSFGLRSATAITSVTYFPIVGKSLQPCPLPGAPYGTVAVISAPTNPPAEVHPDLNLSLRGYTTTTGTLGLVDIPTVPDPNAPLLFRLFVDSRVPVFNEVDQVYDWDWLCNCRGAPIADPPVTLAFFRTAVNEPICAPGSGYDIGRRPATGYSMMVLYASANRITLKYTREDNVINGYTLHVEDISVDPDLLALYQAMNAAGRSRLPALYGGQPIGTPLSNQIGVAIRDTGSFLDPRSHNDWWQGK